MADARHKPAPLGASGLKVSKLWLGTMMFGDQTDAAEAARIVDATREAGLNAIDTADVYAGGESPAAGTLGLPKIETPVGTTGASPLSAGCVDRAMSIVGLEVWTKRCRVIMQRTRPGSNAYLAN